MKPHGIAPLGVETSLEQKEGGSGLPAGRRLPSGSIRVPLHPSAHPAASAEAIVGTQHRREALYHEEIVRSGGVFEISRSCYSEPVGGGVTLRGPPP